MRNIPEEKIPWKHNFLIIREITRKNYQLMEKQKIWTLGKSEDKDSSADTITTEVTVKICNLCETQLSTEHHLYK